MSDVQLESQPTRFSGVVHTTGGDPVKVAFGDLSSGLARWRTSAWLGWRDAVLPFRRTIIGPFWITFQTLIWVIVIFALFHAVMGASEPRYATYLAVGVVFFQFMNNMMVDGAASFTKDATLIQNIPNPLSIYLLRVFFKSIILFFVQSPVIIGALILNGAMPEPIWLVALLGFALVAIVFLGMSLALASLSTLYRDIPFAFSAIMRVMFFATPIFWLADVKGGVRAMASLYNPLAHLLSMVREPFLGNLPSLTSLSVTLGLGVVFWVLGVLLFSRIRPLVASNL